MRTAESTLTKILDFKGTQAWNFFKTFFAETETLWSQGPVTQDFENRIRVGRDIRLFNISAYAQSAMKSFPRMLSQGLKSFPSMLRVW